LIKSIKLCVVLWLFVSGSYWSSSHRYSVSVNKKIAPPSTWFMRLVGQLLLRWLHEVIPIWQPPIGQFTSGDLVYKSQVTWQTWVLLLMVMLVVVCFLLK